MTHILIINETHSIYPEQQTLLDSTFASYDVLKSPRNGWSEQDIRDIELEGRHFIFLSPVPLLLARCALAQGRGENVKVTLFFNETRQSFEKDGAITHRIQNTNWKLVALEKL